MGPGLLAASRARVFASGCEPRIEVGRGPRGDGRAAAGANVPVRGARRVSTEPAATAFEIAALGCLPRSAQTTRRPLDGVLLDLARRPARNRYELGEVPPADGAPLGVLRSPVQHVSHGVHACLRCLSPCAGSRAWRQPRRSARHAVPRSKPHLRNLLRRLAIMGSYSRCSRNSLRQWGSVPCQLGSQSWW